MNVVFKRFTTLILGIILLIVGLLLNRFNLVRLFLCLVSILLLTYSNQLERNNKKVFIPLLLVFFFFFVVALDYLCVSTIKRTPIFAYSVVKNDSGIVYNCLGYRVWSCSDKTFKVDPLYRQGYYCNTKYETSENINNVLSNVVNNFDSYKGTYVKIAGRVTKIVDDKKIYMVAYKEENNVISFDDTYKLYVEFNSVSKELSSLVEESIVVVSGKLDRKIDNEIYMIDSEIIKENASDGKLYLESDNGKCEISKDYWFETTSNVFYKSCLDGLNMSINGVVYDLEKALQNNLITMDEIKGEAKAFQKQSKGNSVMYIYDYFKILECDPSKSKDIIVGQTTMEFSDGYCKY